MLNTQTDPQWAETQSVVGERFILPGASRWIASFLAAHDGKRTVKISSDLAYDYRASGVSIGDVVNSSGYAGSTRPE